MKTKNFNMFKRSHKSSNKEKDFYAIITPDLLPQDRKNNTITEL